MRNVTLQTSCLALGFALEIELVGVVDEPVEDGVGQRGIGNPVVPVLDGELGGDDGGFLLVTIVKDFKQISSGRGFERRGRSPGLGEAWAAGRIER